VNSTHDLVVGGSGMLSRLSERLAGGGRTVSVIARNADRLERLANHVPNEIGRIVPVPVDYSDARALHRALTTLTAAYGRPVRSICWIHDEVAPGAPLQIAEFADGVYWHVLGSAAGDPAKPDIVAGWRHRFGHRHPDLDYRHIVLGFVTVPGGRSRWLTDREISDGVEAALTSGNAMTTVGTTAPWSFRP
jgi:NAD(P)-dependent dehydrogenase (short-subunit alcohol dehydrogenase family)